MTRRTLVALALTGLVGVLVYAGGVAVVPPGAHGAVLAGVLLACGLQALLFVVTASVVSGLRLVAYAVGAVARMLLLAVAALVVVPLTGLPALPLLLTLVAALLATTLLEPVARAAGTTNETR